MEGQISDPKQCEESSHSAVVQSRVPFCLVLGFPNQFMEGESEDVVVWFL